MCCRWLRWAGSTASLLTSVQTLAASTRRGEPRERLDPKLAGELHEEATRAGGAAEADPEAEFPSNASISWPNRSRMLTQRLRQSEYNAIQRADEQRHIPASTLALPLPLDKLGEQHAS